MEPNFTDYESFQNQNIQKTKTKISPWKFWQKRRYIVGMLMFCGFFTSSILRVNMSMAIVAMTSNSTEMEAEFDWDSRLQGYILSSSSYGYMSTMFLGGWLSSRIGGKRVFGIGISGAAFTTLITPPLVRVSVYCLFALRILGGLFQGLTLACAHDIWSKWSPPLERSKLMATAYAGYPIGATFAMFTCGLEAERFGWPYIFYTAGFIGMIFIVFWFLIITDDPADDPKISDAELKYIKKSLGVTGRVKKKIAHPWKAIFTSTAVWAIITANFSKRWGAGTISTQLPKFMISVFNYKLEEIGFLSGLPHLLVAIVLPCCGYLADYLRVKEILSTTKVRKIFTSAGLLGPMICMILAAFCEHSTIIVICIIISVPLGGLTTSGFGVNYLDIAPQHASVLSGISATAGMIPNILSPILTGYIVEDGTIAQWRIIFIIASVIYLVGALTYTFLASGNKQKWAEDAKNENHNIND